MLGLNYYHGCHGKKALENFLWEALHALKMTFFKVHVHWLIYHRSMFHNNNFHIIIKFQAKIFSYSTLDTKIINMLSIWHNKDFLILIFPLMYKNILPQIKSIYGNTNIY